MKRNRKLLLISGATLGVIVLGGFWLVHSAIGVVSDAFDTTLDGAKTVHTIVQKEAARSDVQPQNASGDAAKTYDNSAASSNKSDATVTDRDKDVPTSASSSSSQNAVDRSVTKGDAKAKSYEDDKENWEQTLASLGGIARPFLDEGDSPFLDPGDLLNPLPKSADKSDTEGTDGLFQFVPGLDSPTLERWDAGKYRGKELQAVDDALEDPKLWRLVFTVGGM